MSIIFSSIFCFDSFKDSIHSKIQFIQRFDSFQFSWSCQRPDESSCLTVVNSNESVKPLEVRLSQAELTSPVLNIPKAILPIGM